MLRQGVLYERLQRISACMQRACMRLSDSQLRMQFDPEFSPIGWHLGHVAWQEEMWVLRNLKGRTAICPAFDEVFDAFRPDKYERGQKLPTKGALLEYRLQVRSGVLECLDELLQGGGTGLMQGPGLLRFVANHESQHLETVLALRLAGCLPFGEGEPTVGLISGDESYLRAGSPEDDSYASAGGGEFWMGSDNDPDRWDNECPAHLVKVAPFRIQQTQVDNAAWLDFITHGGYQDERLWSKAGWRFVTQYRVRAPLYWERDALGQWHERTLTGLGPLRMARPVCHVSWYEAQAFAQFSGVRLPSEAEWEWAARSGVETDSRVCSTIGRVWEWTRDSFMPYAGFVPQPYRGYSAPWFDGNHRVARGGSYVTQPEIARATFRNWYAPSMRRAFLGVRLAKDAA